MAVIKKGIQAAGQQPDIEMIPGRGFVYRPKSEYLDRDAALSDALDYYVSGIRAVVVQKGDSPIWRVEAQQEGDPSDPNADLQNTHELRVNVLNPDIKANRYLQSQFTAGTAAKTISTVEKLANAVRSADDAEDAYADALIQIDLQIPVADADRAVSLLDMLLTGVETYIDFQYVYTHTFNFGRPNDQFPDFSNVRCIFDTSEVLAAENLPTGFGLPDGEWVKLPPEKTEMVGGRYTMKYEYWWAELWESLLYPRAV
jgi:hypothetical protein